MTLLLGVDLYDGQGYPDWPKVFASGVSYAIIKATESFHNVQDTFQYNRTNAPAAGISPLGLYHFARPESGNPKAQANHFCDVIGTLGADEFLALDLESGDESTWGDFSLQFWAQVEERLGPLDPRRCVNYLSDDPSTRMPSSMASHPLWDAGYGANNGQIPAWGKTYQAKYAGCPFEHSWNTGSWDTWTIWQFCSVGRVPGIGDGKVNVDMNLAPLDLKARLGISTVIVPPVPAPIPPAPIPPITEDSSDMSTHIIPPRAEVSIPLPQIGSEFGWTAVGVTLTGGRYGVKCRAVMGNDGSTDWRGFDPDHPEDLVLASGERRYVAMDPAWNELQVVNYSDKQCLGVMVESKK